MYKVNGKFGLACDSGNRYRIIRADTMMGLGFDTVSGPLATCPWRNYSGVKNVLK
jgi:hypothetical protein